MRREDEEEKRGGGGVARGRVRGRMEKGRMKRRNTGTGWTLWL